MEHGGARRAHRADRHGQRVDQHVFGRDAKRLGPGDDLAGDLETLIRVRRCRSRRW
jgi:hypothetical protein